MNRRESKRKKPHKNDPQKKHRLGTVSRNILLEGLNWFNSANLILSSDVDKVIFTGGFCRKRCLKINLFYVFAAHSVLRITIWHHEACQAMINGDPEKQIFISHPHTNNGIFFLLSIDVLFKINFQKSSLNAMRCNIT